MKNTLIKRFVTVLLIAGLYAFTTAHAVEFERSFLHERHTLEDAYLYKKNVRVFQWGKIDALLTQIQTFDAASQWGILQNNKNKNGRPPQVRNGRLDIYYRHADAYGIQQYQGIPLYNPEDLSMPERYALDGALVEVIDSSDKDFALVKTVTFAGEWKVPQKYLRLIAPNTAFHKVIIIDRKNQNIVTLEKNTSQENLWMVRSMNPATTGVRKPPHRMDTPLGLFVLQERKRRMQYLNDETKELGGFSPYASRFSGGGYIHGIPVDLPRTQEIEFSASLGTTPRSHKCVRNATSHAKFIYEWAPVEETLVAVIE